MVMAIMNNSNKAAPWSITTTDGVDVTALVMKFVNMVGLERVAPGRYSLLLVFDLINGYESRRLNPAKIMCEIEALEKCGQESRLKAPVQNKHQPLKGLWHKHYLPDSVGSIARNLFKGLKNHGLPQLKRLIDEAIASGEERYFSEQDVNIISHDAVYSTWERLIDNCELTGEWIIFAKHGGKNYYLCIGNHDKAQHANLRKHIDAVCCKEFPFLSSILS